MWILSIFAAASVFIFSIQETNPNTFIFENSDLVALALGEQITDPTFTGVTDTDDAFSIGARSATPNGPRPTLIELDGPTTSVELASGDFLFARANGGSVDLESRTVELSGGATITTSNGYQISSNDLSLQFSKTAMSSNAPVEILTPFGSISAGRMTVTANSGQDPNNNLVIDFSDGVKVLFNSSEER